MKTGIRKISIYNPSTKDVVQLNKIGTDSIFEQNIISVEDSEGKDRYAGIESRAEIICYDMNLYTTLFDWSKNYTKVNMVAEGVDSYIFWREDTYVIVAPKYYSNTGQLNGFTISLSNKGNGDKIKIRKNFWMDVEGFEDKDNNGRVDGWTFDVDPGTTNFSNDIQEIIFQGAMDMHIEKNIIFPIANAQLKSNIYEIQSTVTNRSVIVYLYDKNNNVLNVIDISYELHPDNFNILLPSNVYRLMYQIYLNATAQNQLYKFGIPLNLLY